MKHTLRKRGLWLLTLLVTLVFALGMTAQAADQPEEPEACDRAGRCAFRDRDDEAGDIYEQQYEGRVRREKERKGHG